MRFPYRRIREPVCPRRDLTSQIRHRERRRQLARELLQLEEADAWFEYLESTAGRAEERYREVELSAWARLGERLRAVKARLSRLRPAAA